MLQGERRDPRFDERCGHFNQDLFTKSFDFLKDMKVRELSEVEKELKKTKDAHRREKLQRVLKTAVRKLLYNFNDFNVSRRLTTLSFVIVTRAMRIHNTILDTMHNAYNTILFASVWQ